MAGVGISDGNGPRARMCGATDGVIGALVTDFVFFAVSLETCRLCGRPSNSVVAEVGSDRTICLSVPDSILPDTLTLIYVWVFVYVCAEVEELRPEMLEPIMKLDSLRPWHVIVRSENEGDVNQQLDPGRLFV